MIDFLQTHWVSLTGSIIGLLYLYLEYKANIYMWVASILMAVFYIYIFYTTQLYASMVIYIYFLVASVYGWFRWLRYKREDDHTNPVISPKRATMQIIVNIVISLAIIWAILHYFTINPQYIKLGDALTTALNIVALWMISKKWAEQWLLVIPANGLSSILLFIQGDNLSSGMFLIYFIVSIAGYYKWKKLALDRQNTQ